MTQYPDEKHPHSSWVNPAQEGAEPPYPYTSRDGARAPPPSDGPPPDYGYVESHPDGRSAYDSKGPSHEMVLAPPPGVYDTPDAGPSSSPSQDGGNGGVMMSMGAFFGNKGPPPMWQRQPPSQLPYNGFPPMRLISNGHDLSKGFPELPPPCQLNPHPFATHDVMEEDWKRWVGWNGGVGRELTRGTGSWRTSSRQGRSRPPSASNRTSSRWSQG